jgi:hypothetical protein
VLLLLLAGLSVRPAAAQPQAQAAPAPPPALIERLLSDSSFKVRVQAAIVLGRHASPQGVHALLRALGDPHPAVRAAAAISLGKIGHASVRRALQTTALDPEELVADAAREALALLDVRAAAPPASPVPGSTSPAQAAAGTSGADPGFSVSGGGLASARSPAEVRQVADALSGPLQGCGQRQAKRDPGFTGVVLKLRILPDGKALLAPGADPPLTEDRFRSCIEQALAGLRLPPAAGGDLVLTWPLRVS